MKSLKFILIAVLVILITFASALYLYYPCYAPVTTVKDGVRYNAEDFALNMVAYYVETGGWPVPEFVAREDYTLLASDEMDRYFDGRINHIRVKGYDGIDRWVEPYRVLIRGVGANDRLLDSIDPNATIVVWSTGKNRKNEYGKGDDISYCWETDAALGIQSEILPKKILGSVP